VRQRGRAQAGRVVHCQPASKKKRAQRPSQRQRQRQRTATATGPKRSDSGASILRPPLVVRVISVLPTAADEPPPSGRIVWFSPVWVAAPLVIGLLFSSLFFLCVLFYLKCRFIFVPLWVFALAARRVEREVFRVGKGHPQKEMLYIPRPPRRKAAVARPSGQAQK
jgi:hypothetical protein